MENFGIVIGIIFWPTAIIAWFLFFRHRFQKMGQIVGSVLIIVFPLLAVFGIVWDAMVQEPLIHAASDGDLRRVEHQLALGASPNGCDEGGRSIIAYAVGSGHADVVRVLLEHHADPNPPNEYGRPSPLSDAEQSGNKEIVQLLRQAGAHE